MILIIDNTMDQSKAMYFPYLMKVVKGFKGVRHRVVRTHEELVKIPVEKVTSVVISGSPLMVTQGSFVENLDQFLLNVITVLRYNVPVIGICFGCQLLNAVFGGRLRKLRKPFCQDARMQPHDVDVRFCLSYVIRDVAPDFKTLAYADVRGRNVPCYIKHKTREIYGCLFHPEYHRDTHTFLLDSFLRKTYKDKL